MRSATHGPVKTSGDQHFFVLPRKEPPREECKETQVFKAKVPASAAPKTEKPAKTEDVAAVQQLAEAHFKLGEMYYKGEGVERDFKLAHDFFFKSALAGNTSAIFRFGMMLHYGVGGITPNITEGLEWITRAAEQNHPGAQYIIGCEFLNGEYRKKDYPTARIWLTKAATQGHSLAMHALGKLFRSGGIGVDRDYKASKRWYEMAAEQGNAGGELGLWIIHSQGLGVEKNSVLARQWLDRAASHDTNAKITLALVHIDCGQYSDAYKIFMTLGALGNIRALKETQRMHLAQQGVTYNEEVIKKLQKKIDDAKAAEAERIRGDRFRYNGEHRKALQCYFNAASMGDADAHYSFGMMHEQGLGVKKDYTIARDRFVNAATQDQQGMAIYALALIWEHGLGVQRNYKVAYRLYRDAAASTAIISSDALFKIGRMHEQGLGVEQSDAEARKWFQRAANEGDCYARDALARLAPENHLETSDSEDDLSAPVSLKGLVDEEEPYAEAVDSSNPQALLVAQQKVLTDKLLGLEFSLEEGSRVIAAHKKDHAALKAQIEQSKDKDLTSLHGRERELESLIQRETLNQQAAEERAKIFADDNLSSFYCCIQTIFNGTFIASQSLMSGMLGKAQATKATKGVDSATSAIGFIKDEIVDSIPVVGGLLRRIFTLLSSPLKAYGDFERGKAVMYMASIVNGPATFELCAEVLARQLALAMHEEIRKIATDQPVGFFRKQLQKAKDLKEQLLAQNTPAQIREFAEKQCEVLLIAIMTNKVKPSRDPIQVITQLIHIALGPTFEPTVTILLQRPEEIPTAVTRVKSKPSTDVTKLLQEHEVRLKQQEESRKKQEEELQKLKESQPKSSTDLVLPGAGDQCLELALPESQTPGAGLSSGLVKLVHQTDQRVIQLGELVALLAERFGILEDKVERKADKQNSKR
ncbi:MAG: SEL1-like repeat protein [Chlamydiales bacterium]|nr:SEL1-like repeat protein [Chlamydiales bacterium]